MRGRLESRDGEQVLASREALGFWSRGADLEHSLERAPVRSVPVKRGVKIGVKRGVKTLCRKGASARVTYPSGSSLAARCSAPSGDGARP